MKHQVNHGGLMRCCLHSLGRDVNEPEAAEGAVLQCVYCKSHMRLTRGVWAWAPALDAPPTPKEKTP